MKTLIWNGPKQMDIEEAEEPSLLKDEVLIKVDAVGICGSEIEGFLGHNSLRVPPLVMGHEFSGTIEKLGTEVEEFSVGTKVVINPLISCGTCDRCRRGLENLCDNRKIIGIHRPGAFAEYVAVAKTAIVTVPSSLDSFTASLAEPLACSLRAARRALQAHPFTNVLVFGAGTIGLLNAFVAQILGANKVIVADINDNRLQTIQKVGIEYVANPSSETFEDDLAQITGDKGIDVVIDAAGFKPTRLQALELVNPGGVVMNVGLGINETPIPVNDVIRTEVAQLGSFCYTKQDFHDAVQLLVEGKITKEGWSEIRPLEEGQQAFMDLVEGKVENSKIFLKI